MSLTEEDDAPSPRAAAFATASGEVGRAIFMQIAESYGIDSTNALAASDDVANALRAQWLLLREASCLIHDDDAFTAYIDLVRPKMLSDTSAIFSSAIAKLLSDPDVDVDAPASLIGSSTTAVSNDNDEHLRCRL
uniref:Uncharacterized protein n=1 Tax=Leersia perrieri TaxID=77586 RepID=A0A0D9UWW7_9ORYZ